MKTEQELMFCLYSYILQVSSYFLQGFCPGAVSLSAQLLVSCLILRQTHYNPFLNWFHVLQVM